MKMRAFCLALCAFVLIGCANKYRLSEVSGVGRLDLPPKTWTQLKAFTATPGAIYMSVDPVSGGAYFANCPEQNCVSGDNLKYVIDRCSSQYNRQCKLLATGRGLVWDGPIYVSGTQVWTPEIGRQNAELRRQKKVAQRKRRGVLLDIHYRISDRAQVGQWRPGTAWMRKSEHGATLYIELQGGAVCDANLTPGLGPNKRPTPLKGSISSECFDKRGKHISSLEGEYESGQPYTGTMKASDLSGRLFEVWYERQDSAS